MKKVSIFILLGLLLSNCTMNRSTVGANMGALTVGSSCYELSSGHPVVTSVCAVGGAMLGAEAFYNSDKDVHLATFVDHLNNAPNRPAYTTWYNPLTNSSGIVKTTSFRLVRGFKCADYDLTANITNHWPVIGTSARTDKVVFGTACQTPDGRWFNMPANQIN